MNGSQNEGRPARPSVPPSVEPPDGAESERHTHPRSGELSESGEREGAGNSLPKKLDYGTLVAERQPEVTPQRSREPRDVLDVLGAVEPIASLEYFEDDVGDSGMEAQLIENTAWGSVQEHEREETRREQEQRRHGHASANDASHSPARG